MSLQGYFENFRTLVSMGGVCGGDECGGWHLSEVDTWHECSCNATLRARHPEDDREPETEADVAAAAAWRETPEAQESQRTWERRMAAPDDDCPF